jgi:glycosyltransferase involved in cell wall biosynthesis
VSAHLATSQRLSVLSLQTPLLGNRTYGMLLRDAFARSERIAFDAHWSTEEEGRHASRPLERQLQRVFLKMIERPWIRERNLDLFPLRFEIGTSYWALRTLRALLRTRRPDVLHVHTQGLAFFMTRVMREIPTVVSADGSSFQMAEQRLAPGRRWTFAGNHLLEGRAFRAAAAVVTFSAWAARSIELRHRVPAGRIHVIPPGIDLERFGPPVRARAPGERVRRILFVGGEFERKGGPLLAEAFVARFGCDPSVELHVVTRSERVPDHPRIVVHRNVDAFSPEWRALYASADVFALPTKRDQSPIAYLEAMAAGLPVIATPVGSATEIVADRESGFIVPCDDGRALGDRLERLLAEDGLARGFGERGRRIVEERYEASANARRLAEVFSAVATREPR